MRVPPNVRRGKRKQPPLPLVASQDDLDRLITERRKAGFAAAPSDATAVEPSNEVTSPGLDAAGTSLNAINTLTFGIGKKAAAAGAYLANKMQGGKLTFGDTRNLIDNLGEDAARHNPTINFATELAATVAGGKILPSLAAKVANPWLRAGVNVAESAAMAGTQGALDAEGDASDRLKAGRDAAVMGGGMAAGMHAAGKAGGMLVNLRRPSETGRFGSVFSRYGTPVEEQARGTLLNDIARDRTPMDELITAATEAGEKPATLTDIGGRNVLRRTRGVESTMGPATQEIETAFTNRQRGVRGGQPGQKRRVIGDMEGALPVKPEDRFSAAERLVDKQKAAAKPLYDEAYMTPDIDDPEVLKMFADDDVQQFYPAAVKQAKREGVKLPPLQDLLEGKAALPLQGFDYIKRSMDDFIDAGMSSGKTGRNNARQLRVMLNDALDRVDASRPEFAKARSVFRGDAQTIEAHQKGLDFLKTDDRLVAKDAAKMSPSELEAYRVGALDNITQTIRDQPDGYNVVRKIFEDDIKKDALKTLIGDDAKFAALERALNLEDVMTSRGQFVIGGSPTARIGAEQADNADAALSAATAAVQGNPAGVVSPFLKNTYKRVVRGETERFNTAMAPMLTAGAEGGAAGEAARLRVLRDLEGQPARETERGGRRARFVRGASQFTAAKAAPAEQTGLDLQPIAPDALPADWAELAREHPAFRAYLRRSGVPIR